ncbi:MAG: type II secretion system protein GspG [Candidatus Theseobacter exili]|nr:type II secretion system protein GspG [Candidatus Theseobacter exili]
MRAKNGLSAIGIVFCVAIIGVVIFVVLGRCRSVIFRAKETLMKAELRNLNAGIQLYSIKYGSFPPDIRYLLNRKDFLELKCEVDKENYPLDPFGKRYIYDPGNGKIHSNTKLKTKK